MDGDEHITTSRDEAAEVEGLRMMDEARRAGGLVRAYARGRRVTIAAEGTTHDGRPIVWVGRGHELLSALTALGYWEAF